MDRSPVVKMTMYKGAYYGAIAGLLPLGQYLLRLLYLNWLIYVYILFYYWIALGLNNFILAAYAGFGLHLLNNTRAAVGAVATRWERVKIIIPQQGMLIGIVAGIVIWLALSLPSCFGDSTFYSHIVTLLVGAKTNHMGVV